MKTRHRFKLIPARFGKRTRVVLLMGSFYFRPGALAFEILDGLAGREVLACQAGVVFRVAVGPKDRVAAEAARGTWRAAGPGVDRPGRRGGHREGRRGLPWRVFP